MYLLVFPVVNWYAKGSFVFTLSCKICESPVTLVQWQDLYFQSHYDHMFRLFTLKFQLTREEETVRG